MLHGDISNKSSITIILNSDIFIKAEVKQSESLLPFLSKKTVELSLIDGNVLYLNHIWKKYDMTIYILGILGDKDLSKCEELLEFVCHNSAGMYSTEESLTKAIRVINPEYYFDSDYERKVRIASILPYTKCCMFQEMRSIF